jgi:hypothetical protein
VAEKKPIPLVVVLAPLVAVIGIAGFVGFNLWRDYHQGTDDDDAQQDVGNHPKRPKKHKTTVADAAQVVDAGVVAVDDDDLTNLPKNRPRHPVATAKPVTGTPAQRAYAGFKSAYDKLEAANETAAKKYRTQRLRLEDQLGSGNPANEAKFVADCDALKGEILEALRNPENQ